MKGVSFMKAQIQEKEKELKRDYKMLKESMMQSGVHWNGETCMIEADTTIWDNIITLNSKAKKFCTKSFPLFKALGELYDGHLAEGTYNFTSTEPPKYPLLRQIENAHEQETNEQEVMFPDLEESLAYEIQNEDEVRERNEEMERNEERQRNEERPQRRAAIISRNKYEKERKRPKKSANIEGMMEKYLNMRTKQAEEELHS
uniref:Myb/SANT-like domain-containing protein n=1 Tax=Arundo donax TaxID=35708 RepID=A0A0A8YGK1_ARUDO